MITIKDKEISDDDFYKFKSSDVKEKFNKIRNLYWKKKK